MNEKTTDHYPHRPVRSYVRRAGRKTASQQRALDERWPDFGIESKQPLKLVELFGRDAPLVIEIGFGNGESLVEMAAMQPDVNFLGIEVHEPGVGHCMIGAHKANVTNLRLIIDDAIEVLSTQISDETVARTNLYFPDPWPKKRHHKRRIVQPDFLSLCAQKLKSKGSLHIATDWANYAEHIDEVLDESDHFLISERRVHDGENPLDRPPTKFERRGLRHGHRIWDWRIDKAD
ncbi:MAG: tRNA (guanosine(46)-N7)-methyltransferase TrmB [Pseudomonadota bacterium]